jgi:CheY-like chemotaxis protein
MRHRMAADAPQETDSPEAGTGQPAAAAEPLPNVPIIDRPGAVGAGAPLERPPLEVRKRLLVVDDEPAVLKLVVRILSMDNYEIRSADSGSAAVRLLDEPGAAPVDLLVTDLMMPGMSGRELATVVRSRYPSVRVLYQTGFADSLFAGLKELGDGEAFLEKPFAAAGLLEATRLIMFGHIADDHVPQDKRDVESEWEDNRLRAKVVRLLRRWNMA